MYFVTSSRNIVCRPSNTTILKITKSPKTWTFLQIKKNPARTEILGPINFTSGEKWTYGSLSILTKDTPTFHNIQNPVRLLVPESLTVGLRKDRIGFDPSPVNLVFVVDKVALGQVSLRVLLSSPVTIIPPIFRTHISFINHRF